MVRHYYSCLCFRPDIHLLSVNIGKMLGNGVG